jgi:hypothetical protein
LCLAMRRETLNSIGGFDERFYPGNFEDVDYSIRAVRKGFKLVFCRDAFLYHFGNKTFQKEREDYQTILKNNLVVFMRKWGLQEIKSENELHEIPIAKPSYPEEVLDYPIVRGDYSYVYTPNGKPAFIKKVLKTYLDSPFMWKSRLIIPSNGQDPGELQKTIERFMEEMSLKDNGDIVIYSGNFREIIEGLEGKRCLISSWPSGFDPLMRSDDTALVL